MRTGQKTHPSRRTTLRWVVLASTVVLVGLAAVYAWQARTAYVDLRSAQDRVGVLRQQIADGDLDGARATAERFADDTSSAWEAVHGPHWSALRRLPVVGPNVAAVQEVAGAADELAEQAVPDLIGATEELDPTRLAPVDGRIDLQPIRQAAPRVAAANRTVERAERRVRAIDPGELVGPLRRRVTELDAMLGDLRAVTATANRAAELLPSMLGADGPRHYLLLAQNPAEPRALGGLAGAITLFRAEQGRLELVEHRTASSFGGLEEPVLPLTPAERALYGTQLGRYIGNATSTPDFPRAARLVRARWAEQTGRRVDGVAALDPYALQLLLRATGPVRVPDGRLTGWNAARVLLNQVYLDHPDPQAQDALFADAAESVFDKVTSGKTDVRAVVEQLVEAGEQGRLLLWSAHETEQDLLAGTPLAAELRGKDQDSPVIGVYLHDRTGAKIAYYQRMQVRARESACDEEGARRIHVSVNLRSQVPRHVRRLTDSVTGLGELVGKGKVRTDVLLYAPAGGVVEGVRLDGEPTAVSAHVHDGLSVVEKTVVLSPGEDVTVEYDLVSRGLPGPLHLRTTPAPTEGQFTATVSHCP